MDVPIKFTATWIRNSILNQLAQCFSLTCPICTTNIYIWTKQKTSTPWTRNYLPLPSRHCTVMAVMTSLPRWLLRTWRTVTPEPTGNISRLQYDPLRLDVHYLPAPKTVQSIPALGVVMAQLLFVSLSMPRLWGRQLKATASAAAQGVMLLICDNVSKRARVCARVRLCVHVRHFL